MTVASLDPAASFGRFVPRAILVTIAVHLLAFVFLLLQPPVDGGGGGQVVGQLNIRLSGSGVAGFTDEVSTEPVVEAQLRPPAPRADQPATPVVESVVQEPRVVQAKPVLQQTTEIPRVSEPVEHMPSVRQEVADQGDGNPVGVAGAGAPSLGEGEASPTAGIGSADSGAGGRRDAYLAVIRARIEQNRTYPSAARRRSEEGMATITMTIDGEGVLADVQVISGSGSFHLDRAAKRMIEKSAPFPPPPVTPFTTTIPIVFALQ